METTLQRIGDTLGALADALSEAWAAGAWRPELWPTAMWLWLGALVVLLALAAMRRGQPRPLEVRPPQLLITQGEVVPDSVPEANPRRRRRAGDPGAAAAGSLTMTVSNLSRYPVQLLEVVLREETRGAPRVTEVEAVVPAMGAVDVAVRVPLSLRGDGWIELYCYAAAPRHKLHRHRAELVWEPWASRFKVAPMDQVAAPVRRLASDERHARFEVERHGGDAVEAEGPAAVAEPRSEGSAATSRWAAVAPAEPHGHFEDVDTPVGLEGAPPPVRTPTARSEPSARATAAVGDPVAPTLGALWDRLPRSPVRPAPTQSAPTQSAPTRPAPIPAPGQVRSAEPAAVRADRTSAGVRPPPDAAGAAPPARASVPGADPGGDAAGRDPGRSAGRGPARTTDRGVEGDAGRAPDVDPGAPAGAIRPRPRLEFPDEF